MRKILAGAVVAGAMAVGLAAAPAQAATTTSTEVAASAEQTTTRYFAVSAPLNKGYFKGYWYKKHGHYYFGGVLHDKHHAHHKYTFLQVKYYDKFGRHHLKTYKTNSHARLLDIHFKGDFDLRVCDGGYCGSWQDVF